MIAQPKTIKLAIQATESAGFPTVSKKVQYVDQEEWRAQKKKNLEKLKSRLAEAIASKDLQSGVSHSDNRRPSGPHQNNAPQHT
jgi:hypothetical protein